MRVNIFFNAGKRLDGGPWMILQAMKRMPEVEVYWYECRTNPKFIPKADWNICMDWSEENFGYGDYREPHPNIYWASDTHVSPEAFRFRVDKAKDYDKVYVYNHLDVERFAAEGVKATWLPCAAEPLVYKPMPEIPKKYDIGFVGHFLHAPERMKFLDIMCKAFPNFKIEHSVYFEDAAKALAQCRVILNHIHIDSNNMRVFEGMAAGCLLTYATSDLPKIGAEDGEHCLAWRNIDEAVHLVRQAIDDPDTRDFIAHNGRELILSRHTYVHRAYDLLGIPYPENIQEIIATMPPVDDMTKAPMPVKGL